MQVTPSSALINPRTLHCLNNILISPLRPSPPFVKRWGRLTLVCKTTSQPRTTAIFPPIFWWLVDVCVCSYSVLHSHGAFDSVVDTRCSLCNSAQTAHTSHVTHHTSHFTHQTSHVARHTSHITHHTSHITHHTSHITRHTYNLPLAWVHRVAARTHTGPVVSKCPKRQTQGE